MSGWTIEELHAWQFEMLDKAALSIAKALNALPREYADAHQNHDVGGRLHSAIGSLAALRGTMGGKHEALILERARKAAEEVNTERSAQE